MTTASPRLRALLAAGVTLLAFGMTATVHASPGKGANQDCAPYCSTTTDPPAGSQNGNGQGNATGRPGAGTVGNADDKNPPGQAGGGGDANNGYECDHNSGVAKTNPAHSGCDEGTGPYPGA